MDLGRCEWKCANLRQFLSKIVQSWDSFAIDTICFLLRAYLSKRIPQADIGEDQDTSLNIARGGGWVVQKRGS